MNDLLLKELIDEMKKATKYLESIECGLFFIFVTLLIMACLSC